MGLQDIKESYAKDQGFIDWELYKTSRSRRTIRNFDLVVTAIANRYASESNKELVDILEKIVYIKEETDLDFTIDSIKRLIEKYKQDGNVLDTNCKLVRLTEMSGDHFEQIFIKGFAPSKIKSDVAKMNSLFGFHDMIAKYGHFESYSTAVKLNYDVEFKLDRVQNLDTTHEGKEETI